MFNTQTGTGILPVRLGPKSTLKFRCHKGVKCFTECCRGINIVLTPYDIICLKKRLNLTSEEFLAIYTDLQVLEKTDLPIVTLKMMDDERQSCPFVRADGCLIYSDRPTTCRYYPIGVAALSHKEGADDKDFYIMVNEPHCLGFEEDTEWTIEDWRKDQEVDSRDEINAGWTDLVVLKRSFPKNVQLTDQAKKMFFLASYNLDKFKKFIFESSFLNRYDIDEETLNKIKADEIALLQFGMKWLKGLFFKGEKFNLKSSTNSTAKQTAAE